MDDQLVSVIVPIYKVEPYLKKCIDSIVNQTYRNLEIILVDDGSPDNCPAICDEYAARDPRVKVIHKENGGQAEARNFGMKAAKGDYFLFVDADDYMDVSGIGELYGIAKAEYADIVIADTISVNEDGIILDSSRQYPFYDLTRFTPQEAAVAFADMPWGPWNKLYARMVHEKVDFPAHTIHEDEAIMFQLIHNSHRIVYTKKKLYYYVQRGGSTTALPYSTRKMDWFNAWKRNYGYVKAVFPEAEDKTLAKLLMTAIYNLDNLLRINDDESKIHINRIIHELTELRWTVLKSREVKPNYKLRVFLATTNISFYQRAYSLRGAWKWKKRSK